ncbi:uncharacterized protein Dwil_GK25413 [Drosophila willistoni]|uniref:Uncharacterized protein n=1 Tax=Drosophila willistoni TaxID=7260 RepID=B4NDS7_DROWI|nr:uncharacterized protein LOC6649056 [Drosophila willistoni]EDW81896.1 uncharacterized protein Dwil_GK25413 [Drosophila willistoni]
MATPMEEHQELRSEGMGRRRQMGARRRRDAAQTFGQQQQTKFSRAKWVTESSKTGKSLAVVRPQHSHGSGVGSTLVGGGGGDVIAKTRTNVATSRSAFGRSYVAPIVSAAATKTPRQTRFRSVKAKVDSHLCPGISSMTSRMPIADKNNKPLTAAHEQLELLLNQIEQSNDPVSHTRRRRSNQAHSSKATMRRPMDQRPMPPAPAASPMMSARRGGNLEMASTVSSTETARRSLKILDVHTGSFISYEESLRRHPASSPGRSPRPIQATASSVPVLPNVPLVHNPQLLPQAKRDALVQLLSRAEQHDKGIVDILRSSPCHDPSRETMRMMLQMLPLNPGDSPYGEKFWAGHRYLEERQKLHQQLKPDDIRFKEVKIIREPNGQMYLSRTLEEELKDEKMVLEFMEAEMKRLAKADRDEDADENDTLKPLNERQERAMRERAELDAEKQRISDLRAKHNRAEMKKTQKVPETDPNISQQGQSNTDTSAQSIEELIGQRYQFRAQCQRSCLYNNPHNAEPWKLYANVAKNISCHLVDNIDGEFNRSVANYIKDFVDSETHL